MNKTINIILAVIILLIAGLGFLAYQQNQKISILQRSLEGVESRTFTYPGEALGIVESNTVVAEEVVNGMLGKIKSVEDGAIILSVEFLEGKKAPGFPFVDAKINIDANTKFREEVISRGKGIVEIVDKERVDISSLKIGTTIFVKATDRIAGSEVLAKEIEIMRQIKK